MTATDNVVALPLNLHEYEAAARAVLPPMAFTSWPVAAAMRSRCAATGRRLIAGACCHGCCAGCAMCRRRPQSSVSPSRCRCSSRPRSLHRLCHDEGERATARAARAAGTIYTMSTAATIAIEEVAAEAGPWWFQLYVYRDRGLTRDLVARAAAAGASALVVTVDMPAPDGGRPTSGTASPCRPGWSWPLAARANTSFGRAGAAVSA